MRHQRRAAVSIMYDVNPLLSFLVLDNIAAPLQQYGLSFQEAVDLWITAQLHELEVVTAIEKSYYSYALWTDAVRLRHDQAVSWLYRHIRPPLDVAGSEFFIKRHRELLIIVYVEID